MDIGEQCRYRSKMYPYIGTYSTDLCGDHQEWILYVSAEQLPEDCSAIKHNNILLPFIHEPHSNPCPHPSNNDSSNTEANSQNACVNPERTPVCTDIHGTPHWDNCLAGKPIRNEYFDFFDNGKELRSHFYVRRSIEYRTCASSTTEAELLSTSCSGTLRCLLLTSSLGPTRYSNG